MSTTPVTSMCGAHRQPKLWRIGDIPVPNVCGISFEALQGGIENGLRPVPERLVIIFEKNRVDTGRGILAMGKVRGESTLGL